MDYRKFGTTDLSVSRICFGAWAIGGDSYGGVNDEDSINAIHTAIDQGINFFDTAPIYGKGHSEEVLGKAIKDYKREEIIVASKFGLVWDDQGNVRRDSSPENIRREIDDSLRRLNTDYIDLYQVHWPDANVPFEETARTLEDLKKEGKIRYIGVSNFSPEEMKAFMQGGKLDSLQPPYHLLARDIEKEILPFCEQNEIAVFNYGSMAHGLLSGKFDSNTTFGPDDMRPGNDLFQGENFQRNVEIASKLKKLAEESNMTAGQLAIAWVLNNPVIDSAIVGAKTSEQVKDNAAAGSIKLSENILEKIDQIFEGIEPYKAYLLD